LKLSGTFSWRPIVGTNDCEPIRHAIGQLEVRSAAKQVGSSKTWRYAASA